MKKQSMQKFRRSRREGIINANDQSSYHPSQRNGDTDLEQVGAFAVAGIGGASSAATVAASSLTGTAEATSLSTQASTVFSVLNARIVDEETPSFPMGPIIEAMPMDEFDPTETAKLRNAPRESQRCRIIVALAAVLALVVGVIVAVVLVTQNASKTTTNNSPTQAPQRDINETARDEFLADLTPSLSNESLSALDNPDSPQSLSIGWLLGTSNFQELSFQRQVQRYAMATIYYATGGGTSWSNVGNWLTSDTECTWVQGSAGDFCDENGTLHYLNQSNNGLNGKIPDEIRLLRSLKAIDLNYNKLYGTIPIDTFGDLPSLQVLILSNNLFTGTLSSSINMLTSLQELDLSSNPSLSNGPLPSEIGALTNLTHLNLFDTKISNQIPTEVGFLTELQFLSLGANMMTGTIPTEVFFCTKLSAMWLKSNSFSGTLSSQFGFLTALSLLYVDRNYFTGSVPSELGSLTKLTVLALDQNDFNGTVPDEVCNLGTVDVHRACDDILACRAGCCNDYFC
jgi:Leucine-rich repeat (LRR) protein